MGFPTVKSDPYKKRARRRQKLWSAKFWRELIAIGNGFMTPEVVAAISEMNDWMYGKR